MSYLSAHRTASLKLFTQEIVAGHSAETAWQAHRERMQTSSLCAHAVMLVTLEAVRDFIDSKLDTGNASPDEISLLREVCGAILIGSEATNHA